MKNLALWAPWSLLYITLKRYGYERVWPGMSRVALIFLLLSGSECACVSQALDTLLLSCPLFFLRTNIPTREFSTQSVLNNSVSKLMIKLASPFWYLLLSADILESSFFGVSVHLGAICMFGEFCCFDMISHALLLSGETFSFYGGCHAVSIFIWFSGEARCNIVVEWWRTGLPWNWV